MNKALHTFIYGLAGLLLYIPGAVIVCIYIATWYENSNVGAFFLIFPAAYLVGSYFLAMAAGPKFNLSHFFAFIVVPFSGAFVFGVLLLLFPHDKGIITLAAPFVGLVMWVTAKLALRLFEPSTRAPQL